MKSRQHPNVLLVLVLACAACGTTSASSRTKALRVELVSITVARDTVLAAAKEREKQIYGACNPPACSKEEGHAKVDAWRAQVDVVFKAIDVAYRAIHDAALLDDDKSESNARTALGDALKLIKELK